ncbi:MAG TPA: ParB/RepB/Spo0J family partition protein [Chitinophagales bacterium]|nr:ParB/RepB/Spo0J family partition protein [Chitinophagales bacterium]
MTNKRPDLGKGIRALLENMDSTVNNEAFILGSTANILLDQIEVNPFQPRHDFDEAAMQELADSIKIHGVIQPITVRKIAAKKYQLIAGERRLRAAKMAALTEIPAFLRSADDEQMLEMALIENTHREDLNAMEVAINYKRLIDECNLKQEDLAEKVGKNRTTVTNYLRLLKLPPEIQQAIKNKTITMAHARTIINVEDPLVQLHIFRETVKNDLSVRAVESLARDYTRGKKPADKKSATLPHAYQRIQEKISSHLATKVLIKRKRLGKGEIVVSFFSDNDLERLAELLGE